MNKEVKIFGKTLRLSMRNDGDLAIANELFLDHQYQQCDPVIKVAKSAILDIGGHLGFFSLMASTLNPTVPIYSFEPHEGNFKLLKENLKNNRVRNVKAKQLAVSDQIAELELQISQEDLNHSMERALEPTGQTQKVQTITLEKIFEKNRIDHCELLKLDCEGSEFKIIYGSPKSLFKKIDHIFLEYHDWTPGENHQKLKSYLLNLGYQVQAFPNHKIKELGFLWCKK